MRTWKKVALGAGLVGVAAGGLYVYNKYQAGEGLEIDFKPMVHTLFPLAIRVEVFLKNTSKTGLKIKYPFVKLSYKGITLGSSENNDSDVPMPQFSTTALSPSIMIPVPVLGLFSVAQALIDDLKTGKPVNLDVNYKTYVQLATGLKLIEETKSIALKA